ncbi:histone deacetylase family protein [Hyphomicrobium sp.]|jgi:acetoin utilization deacetylase AcuC-like enzyme|uniref:histone deacetylase family protein n=1 Tax=Hyphomicrobium sp. TaxID=82 RepID=UPI002C3F20B3|nr:histone deacetylase family protein [Hyphomicrobium sp.]HVZ04162.1 histone deacetylase family protein [Hyphomicrobium sp.]
MTTVLITHPAFVAHDTGAGHPERPDRMRAIDAALNDTRFSQLLRREAPLRDDDASYIALAHRQRHLDEMLALARRVTGGHEHIDGDTVVSAGTWEAARRAVGAGLDAVDRVVGGEATNAFCQVRPPGHHAESFRAMGFCLFNNVAIAAHYARAKHGLERLAVVDFDVHHGNGTQEIFWSDKNLFYGSTHQMPLFPGTGALRETGVGNIFNAPLRAGNGREQFEEAFRDRILGPLQNFSPDLVLISAGFDAHHRDPLGGLQLTEDDFRWATEALAAVARRHANGRIVSMLEGGYDLTGLAQSVAAHVDALIEAGA